MKRQSFIKLLGLSPLMAALPALAVTSDTNELDKNESLFYFTYDNPVVGYNYAKGLATDFQRNSPKANIKVTSGSEYMSDFLNALRTDTLREFRQAKYDLIVFNDIDQIGLGSATREEFRELVYRAHAEDRKLVVNLPKSKLNEDMKKMLKGFREIEVTA